MPRIQISTSVSDETRRVADELQEKYGYNLRDVVTLGVELLNLEKQGKIRPNKTSQVNLSTEVLRLAKLQADNKDLRVEFVIEQLLRKWLAHDISIL